MKQHRVTRRGAYSRRRHEIAERGATPWTEIRDRIDRAVMDRALDSQPCPCGGSHPQIAPETELERWALDGNR